MRVENEEILRRLEKREELTLFAVQLNKDLIKPFSKFWKKVYPTPVIITRSDNFELNYYIHARHTKTLMYKTEMRTLNGKKIKFTLNNTASFGKDVYFFEEEQEAIDYWNECNREIVSKMHEYLEKYNSQITELEGEVIG